MSTFPTCQSQSQAIKIPVTKYDSWSIKSIKEELSVVQKYLKDQQLLNALADKGLKIKCKQKQLQIILQQKQKLCPIKVSNSNTFKSLSNKQMQHKLHSSLKDKQKLTNKV